MSSKRVSPPIRAGIDLWTALHLPTDTQDLQHLRYQHAIKVLLFHVVSAFIYLEAVLAEMAGPTSYIDYTPTAIGVDSSEKREEIILASM